MVFNSDYQLLKKLNAYKLLLVASLLFLGAFTFWQGYSAIHVHKRYQSQLMERVIDRVDSEYQRFLSELKLTINTFQINNSKQLQDLYDAGSLATKEDYMSLLNKLKQDVPDVRLFSLISPEQIGTVSHITGDFLPDCKEEISSTFRHNQQEELFLHRSAKSMHFDLLIPLVDRPNAFLFVAFNVDELNALLNRYSLPTQELFLLRNDLIGVVELTNTLSVNDVVKVLSMSESEVRSFSFSKPIENTRWNIAIKLADKYKKEILHDSIIRALILTTIFSVVLLLLYRIVSRSTNQLIRAKDYIFKQQSYDALTGAYTKYRFIKSLNNDIKLDSLKQKLCMSFQVISVADVGLQDDEIKQSDFYLKQLANALMELLGEEYTFGRISDEIIAIYSIKLNEEKVDEILKELDSLLSTESQQRFGIKSVALAMDGELQNGVHLVKAHIGCQRDKNLKSGEKLTVKDSHVQSLLAQEQMLSLLLEAIEKQNFILYYQKITSLMREEQACYFEVLVRLKNGEQIIAPDQFIPLAEQTGHIVALDKAVISKTFEKMSLTAEIIHCAINLSGKTITDPSLKPFIKSCLEKYHVSPEHVTFEITETDAVNDFARAQAFIEWATNLGCQFALDDFGKGLSSFSYLQQLPINKLKIDGSFIRNLDTNIKNQMFVKTMTDLAHNMGLSCVAECAEHQAIVDLLIAAEVDYVQGYVVHKPEQWGE